MSDVHPIWTGNPATLARQTVQEIGLERCVPLRGQAFVFSGPSGVGKDTLLNYFLPRFSGCERLVTVTTRPIRDTETDGADYIFVSQERFDELATDDQFLETADVYGFSYGSPKWRVKELTEAGTDVILKLDVQGGLAVKKAMPGAVMIFLAPPSLEELERRLRGRSSETPDALEKRLGKARWEMSLIPEYQYLIVNDTLQQASSDLAAVITAERARLKCEEQR